MGVFPAKKRKGIAISVIAILYFFFSRKKKDNNIFI